METDAATIDSRTAVGQKIRRWSWKKFWLAFLIALLVALVAFVGYMVYDDYYVQQGRFFLGTRVAGIDVSRKSQAWAQRQVEQQIATPLLEPLTTTYGTRKWTLNTPKMAHVDVEGMLRDAYRAGWDLPLWQRLYKRWMKEPLGVEIPVRFTFEKDKISAFVRRLVNDINRRPVDARQYLKGRAIKISPSARGHSLDRKDAYRRVAAALPAGKRQLNLKVAVLQPKVTRKDFEHAIYINLSENRLYLYTYEKMTKSYRVATGSPGFRTPTGDWKIINKRYNPTWVNPREPWSMGMPDRIGPGPGNPLGTRALDLNAPAIRIHGTYSSGSIGSYASHGCIRMYIWESEDLYDRVDVGTPVYIRW